MEMIFLFFLWYLVVPITAIVVIVKMIEENRQFDEQHKLAIQTRESLEESVDDILERHRQGRRTRRARQKNEWDEEYLLSLPVEEHPDYFKLDPNTDEVEGFVQKSADGTICSRFESRISATGVAYTAQLDHVTKTIYVNTGRISWYVPFSEVDNYTQYL